MSNAITFDTHRFVKRLVETGMSEQTAEALADEQISLLNENLATKQDIETIRAELKADIAKTETKLQKDIANVRLDLIKWMAGMFIGFSALIISMVRFI